MSNDVIKNDLSTRIVDILKNSELLCNSKEVYAIALDIGEEMFWIKFQTTNALSAKIKYFKEESIPASALKYPNIYTAEYIEKEHAELDSTLLTGFKYNTGDFQFVSTDFAQTPDDIDLLIDAVNEIKSKLDFIDTTSDFVFYLSLHDASDEDRLALMSKTIEESLFKSLTT